MTSGVYQILNTVNGKCYVGSSATIEQRWRTHRWGLETGRHHSRRLSRAVAKYGLPAFEFKVLEECDPSDNVTRELFWTGKLDSIASGYNSRATPNSNLGLKHSDEARAAMSRSKKGNIAWTAESRAKLSKSLTGRTRSPEVVAEMRERLLGTTQTPELVEKRIAPLRGRKHTPERIAQRVAATRATLERTKDTRPKRIGQKHSEESKLKIGAASRGRTFTAEAREKISAAGRGRVNSPETIAKRVEATRITKEAKKLTAFAGTQQPAGSVYTNTLRPLG
jgi:group I intron endonuclease